MKLYDYVYILEGNLLFSHSDYKEDRKNKEEIDKLFEAFVQQCIKDGDSEEYVRAVFHPIAWDE